MTAPAPARSEVHELGAEFVRREVAPHLDDWEEAGEVPRRLHRTAAEQGLLGLGLPERVGGQGGTLLDTVQLHGGSGYLRGAEVERHYRDARILPIGGGATEVLADLAARLLGFTDTERVETPAPDDRPQP